MNQSVHWLCFIAMLTTALLIPVANAKETEHSHSGIDNSIGVHGMALIPVGNYWLASHMPLHGDRHGHQLILLLDTEESNRLRALTKQAPLISLMPERFSLRALQQGELSGFTATVFRGHFERNGEALLQKVSFTVHKKILDLPLDGNEKANGHYRLVQIGDIHLLVHIIGATPSFDQIIQVSAERDAPALLYSNSDSPLSAENWPASFTDAGIHFRRSLYLEMQDFQ